MRKAIQQAFPNSANIVCVRHLRNNVINDLCDMIETETVTRFAIVNAILGTDGIVTAVSNDKYQL